MKDLIPKLERIMDYYHDREGSTDEFKAVQEVHRFVMDNQWYTLEEKKPPQYEDFIVRRRENSEVWRCRVAGIYFKVMSFDVFPVFLGHFTDAEIVQWRKFPTT
jgi:hypothetical protein